MAFFTQTDSDGYIVLRLGRIIGTALISIFLIVTLIMSFSIVPTGYTGVRMTFGQIDDKPVSAGFNWKIPYVQSIKKVNNKQQDLSFDNQIWSETSERTAIYFEKVTVTYSINGEKSAWIYANVADYENSLVNEGLVASAIKITSKQFSSTDATNRGLVEPKTQEALQKSIDEKYGEDVIYIHKVTISNIDFDDSYNKAIADKMKTQLEYEQQQIENQKNIEKAEADAQIKRTTAQTEADTRTIKAEAEAEANKKIEESLTEQILKNKLYDKWDGELPKVSGSNTLIDIPLEDELNKDSESNEG